MRTYGLSLTPNVTASASSWWRSIPCRRRLMKEMLQELGYDQDEPEEPCESSLVEKTVVKPEEDQEAKAGAPLLQPCTASAQLLQSSNANKGERSSMAKKKKMPSLMHRGRRSRN